MVEYYGLRNIAAFIEDKSGFKSGIILPPQFQKREEWCSNRQVIVFATTHKKI
jgi:hypothetical protein